MQFFITSLIFLSVFLFSTAHAKELSGIRLGSASLDGDANASRIQVSMSPMSTQSCYARSANRYRPNDIPGHHYQINNFVIYWGESRADLFVSYVVLEIRDPYIRNGIRRTYITGTELASLDGSHGQWDRWIRHARPWRETEFHARCGPISGNIQVNHENTNFVANGRVTVVGVRRNYRGYNSSVSFSAPLRVYHRAGF